MPMDESKEGLPVMTSSELQIRVGELYALGDSDPVAALGKARALRAVPALEDSAASARAGLLIDVGSRVSDRAAILEGVELLRVLRTTDPEHATYRYNLANGLLALAAVDARPESISALLAARPWRREARTLLDGLRAVDDRDLATQALTNLGNSLSGSHRWSEALDAYQDALEIDPTNGVAAGAAAQMLLWRSGRGFGDPHKLRAVGARYARIARANEARVCELAGPSAVAAFAKLPTATPAEPFALQGLKPYLRWVAEHHLALVPTVEGLDPKLRRWDSLLLPGLSEPVAAPSEPPVLIAMFNMMKAGYLEARRLAYRAMTTRERQTGLYADTLDYALYGTDVVSLLLAQRSGIDVLDQLAVALNDYLAVGVRADRVDFMKLWRERDAPLWRPVLMDEVSAGNTALVALGELAEDLREGFLKRQDEARNASTHRFTVLHDMGASGGTGPKRWRESAAIEHRNYGQFESETLHTLKAVRAALLYFVEVVTLREHRHHVGKNLLPVLLPQHHHIRPDR
jgi:tetratricopeptide (TPR) repeat protein